MRWPVDRAVKLWNRGSLFSLVLAVLVAAWCVGWLWLLLQATRTMPGLITDQPATGAFELLELPTGLSYPTVLLAIFLFCMLPVLLLGTLRNWWDGKGRALDALLWPSRAKAFWLPCLVWSMSGVALLIFFKSQDGPGLVFMAISMLALMAAPFHGGSVPLPQSFDAGRYGAFALVAARLARCGGIGVMPAVVAGFHDCELSDWGGNRHQSRALAGRGSMVPG